LVTCGRVKRLGEADDGERRRAVCGAWSADQFGQEKGSRDCVQ
jgi:hypothetical protein